eukprot:GHVN01010373.1.p1 GENE.GHVN01010373.1~~GHVN01010373.1.p1  ORF type:complete len:248 (-),score=36.39 GHVN01010373.1:603-1346(-)
MEMRPIGRVEATHRTRNNTPTQVQSLSYDTLEDIKVKCLYTTYKLTNKDTPGVGDEEEKVEFELMSKEDVDFPLDATTTLKIPADVRWHCAECLFGHNENSYSIVDGFLECVKACDIDIRRAVMQNIMLVGGGCEMTGLKTRMALELKSAVESDELLSFLAGDLKLNCMGEHLSPHLQQWTGASVYATIEGLELFTHEEYHQKKPVPDWFMIPPDGGSSTDMYTAQLSIESPFANLPDSLKFLTQQQ